LIIVASLLGSSWCCRHLLTDIVVGLSDIKWLLTCTWGRSSEFLLSSNNYGSVGVLTLLALFICLSILWWYVCRNDQDLTIYSLELFSCIVRGDGCAGDLKCETIRRCLSVQLAVMSRNKRSTNLLEQTALAHHVFRILVDRVGFVEVAPAASTILGLGSRFDLDLALHVA
jgi:hypothetical protein